MPAAGTLVPWPTLVTFEGAFENAKKEGAQAVIVLSTCNHASLAAHSRAIRQNRKFPPCPREIMLTLEECSALERLSRGPLDGPPCTCKIFEGAKPNELPFEMVHRHELVISYKTVREIGLTLPAAIVARTHQAIE